MLATQGLGGTEATVVRVASALSDAHEVVVVQHNRNTEWKSDNKLRFIPWMELEKVLPDADHIIFVQKAQDLGRLRRLSRGRLWLWLHNYVQDEVPLYWQDHFRYRLGIICVSRAHAKHTFQYIHGQSHSWLTSAWALRGGLLYQHNPLKPGLNSNINASYDSHKLTFFSSPYKGIEQVLAHFRKLHEIEPRFRLYVADPGYIKNFDKSELNHSGIVQLGSLPQSEVLQHVRESLCVFYPQTKRAETFGLVYAEANAVGTPVLAHDFGSAREVLSPQNPPIDANNSEEVQRRVFDWQAGRRPIVVGDPRFELENIKNCWLRFLADPSEYIQALEI